MKTVLITGASEGIGKACVNTFYDAGYNVVLFSRSEYKLNAVVSDFEDERVLVVSGDVTDEDDVKRLVSDSKKKFGCVDVLINNAGLGIFKMIEDLSKDDFSKQLDVNVLGMFLVTKHVLPLMKEKDKGQIVNVSSMAGKNYFASGTAYSASKWAVMGFNGSLKQELRKTKIKVAVVCPGSVDTEFFDKAGMSPNKERLLKPESVSQKIFEIATQARDSDIDELVIRPAYNP